MSNLKAILNRLVQENLHGPIDRTQDTRNRHATRQSTAAAADGGGDPGAHPNHHSKPNTSDDSGEDLDGRDPRWRQLFQEYFLSEHSDDRNDDLLFFVQKVATEVENGGLGADPVFVKRKVKGAATGTWQQVLTEEQEAAVLWKDTFFLNVIVQLPCKLTVAVCSRMTEINPVTGAKKTSMTCTRKHVSKRVYALPTKSRVDVKEASVECSWPLIYYVIDDYEDMFEQVMVRDNEYLCVELAVMLPSTTTSGPSSPTSPTSSPLHQRSRALGHDVHWNQMPAGGDGLQVGRPFPSMSSRGDGSGGKITLFQGAAGFQSLLGIYQQKASSKVGRRFKFGPHTVPTEFVMMRGPGGRGHAQVAITASSAGDDSPLETASLPSLPTSPSRDKVSASPSAHGSHSTSPARSTLEKSLPEIPGSNGDSMTHGHGHEHKHHKLHRHRHQEPEKINTDTATSNPKSFSAGSFFNSLRRISLSTLAQVVAGSTDSTPGHGSHFLGQNHVHGSNKSTHSVGSQSEAPSSPTGSRPASINTAGVGSRQEIEALVNQPQSLRCCMTFVNVPWTGIVGLLMDHAQNSID
ncbi:hypothetical protein BGZ98_000627 [Dissophora globulifera]|nr:hypothetical protein BGZ98_000627 [Dissophora globulifera]